MRELRACDAAAGSTTLLPVGMIGRPYSPSKLPTPLFSAHAWFYM